MCTVSYLQISNKTGRGVKHYFKANQSFPSSPGVDKYVMADFLDSLHWFYFNSCKCT